MHAINISGYLTEDKLASSLQVLLGPLPLVRQAKSGKGRSTWDMAYVVDGVTTAVEFDGDDHYCNTLKIKADREKTAFAADNAIRLIRIPFWVQLTTSTLAHYFQMHAEIVRTFPHGFITTKCFPASFCELGVERFRAELSALPSDVKAEVVNSLEDRVIEYGAEYVLPSSLRSLVNRP